MGLNRFGNWGFGDSVSVVVEEVGNGYIGKGNEWNG